MSRLWKGHTRERQRVVRFPLGDVCIGELSTGPLGMFQAFLGLPLFPYISSISGTSLPHPL